MTIATDLVVDRIPRVDGTQEPLASWYTQGLSDGLGDRLLMFDNTNAPSWELLRFRPEFVSTPGFERALRDRVEQLGHFRHPLFTHVRAVEELGFGDGLALVATYAPGRRLSEALVRPRSVGAVIPLIRQLTAALADLQDQGADVAHGALTADRIMVARDGRLIIREHVIGSALARLRLPAGRLWTDLGIMAWPTHLAVPTLDRRTDVVQLALVALSLMLGRRVGPADYPRRIDDLLDRIGETTGDDLFSPLRFWLERALQLNGRVFECAEDARAALSDLAKDGEETDDSLTWRAAPSRQRPSLQDEETGPTDDASNPIEQFSSETSPSRAQPLSAIERPPSPMAEPSSPVENPTADRGRLRWVAAAAVLIAIAEAAVIGRLLYTRNRTPPPTSAAVLVEFAQPGADVLVDGQPAGVTPLALKIGPQTRSIRVVSQEPAPAAAAAPAVAGDSDLAAEPPIVAPPAPTPPAAARPQRSGALRVSSPFELQVIEGEQILGSSSQGPVALAVGRHEFDLVNAALGFRSRRVVEINAGQTLTMAVPRPNGDVSINALPWAEVWLDGTALGQTPLGKVSVPIGEHEILFRHPNFGERREKVIVRSDRLTLVSANFRR
jgi:PEGA domain